MPFRKTMVRALAPLALLFAAGTAQAQMQPVQGIPCAQGLPCNAPPPQVLEQMYGNGGYAPGQVLSAGQPRGPGYMADSFAAISFWRSESGQPRYAYGSRRAQNQEWAETHALAECTNAGGQNCIIGLWGANGHFAITRDGAGEYYAAFAGKLNAARRDALKICRDHGKKCKVVETVDSLPYFIAY